LLTIKLQISKFNKIYVLLRIIEHLYSLHHIVEKDRALTCLADCHARNLQPKIAFLCHSIFEAKNFTISCQLSPFFISVVLFSKDLLDSYFYIWLYDIGISCVKHSLFSLLFIRSTEALRT
jgi:hypothetical protein